MKIFSLFITVLLVLAVTSCSNPECNCPTDNTTFTLEEMYENAIKDAMYPTSKDIVNTLTEVEAANTDLTWLDVNGEKYVLTVVFTDYNSSYPVGDTVETWWGVTWVTVFPELKNFFTSYDYTTDSAATLRVEQLLGLPKKISTKYFVEAYVKPSDLFRPAPDNEIDDNTCVLDFPANVDSAYVKWFDGNILDSYFAPTGKTRYPWTRLGYTYDWGKSFDHTGLSEFVIKQNSRIIVKKVATVAEYLLH